MYIPDDVWNYIKTFMFKTEEMKTYDLFVLIFIQTVKKIIRVTGKINNPEDWIFNGWNFKKQICFIDKYLW